MSNATRKTSWTLGDGRQVDVEIIASRSLVARVIWADGDCIETGRMDPVSSVEIRATIQGVEIARGHLEDAAPNAQGVVAKVGKLGLLPDKATLVRALVLESETEATTPEYLARLAEIEAAEVRADKIEAEYSAHVARVDSMMTLGGRSY